MQILYANSLSEGENVATLQKQLTQKIDKTKQLYFVYLQYLIQVCEYVILDASKRANKFIPTEEDKNVNKDLADNLVLKLLTNSDELKEIQKHFKIKSFIDAGLVKKLFNELKTKEKYVKYCKLEKKEKRDEVDILRYILRRIIGTNELLDEALAEHFINIDDDHFLCLQSLQKIIKSFGKTDDKEFLKSILLEREETEEITFAKELINNYISKEKELNSIIEIRLKNWDMDRVSVVDIILLKMAISEFLYFPYIPLKVSINEYIDISKEYSTEKSKDFINGILDKTMKDLKNEGKIKKLGRGLINN
ncbi:MAG: transcription antitermination factor NusB [Chitinophagales bacterium]